MRAEVEMEGGGSTWWYVCGECHGAINYQADVCPHCKAVLSWDGFGLPGLSNQKKKIYTGEHTKTHIDNILESAKLLDYLYRSAEEKKEIGF